MFALLAALIVLPTVNAHPLHLAIAEADYRAGSNKLEVAVRLFTDDAEVELSRRAGKKVTIEKTAPAALDRMLTEMVKAQFQLKTRDGSVPPLTWIGHELKDADQHLWLYFECTIVGGISGTRVINALLRDSFPDQLNSVLVRDHPAPANAESAPVSMRQITLLFPDASERIVTFAK